MSTRDTDTRFSSDTDFSEDPDGRNPSLAKGKVLKAHKALCPWFGSGYPEHMTQYWIILVLDICANYA